MDRPHDLEVTQPGVAPLPLNVIAEFVRLRAIIALQDLDALAFDGAPNVEERAERLAAEVLR